MFHLYGFLHDASNCITQDITKLFQESGPVALFGLSYLSLFRTCSGVMIKSRGGSLYEVLLKSGIKYLSSLVNIELKNLFRTSALSLLLEALTPSVFFQVSNTRLRLHFVLGIAENCFWVVFASPTILCS